VKTKDDVLDALRKEGPSKAFDLYFDHMTKMRFLEKCGLLLHPCMHHKIGLNTVVRVSKKDGGYFSLWHVLDWVTQELLVQTAPASPLETRIKLDLEAWDERK
jgi:hypothetical protein